MFDECTNLKYFPDLEKWDISNVINMEHMFSNCSNIVFLPDLSKWEIKKGCQVDDIFSNCPIRFSNFFK